MWTFLQGDQSYQDARLLESIGFTIDCRDYASNRLSTIHYARAITFKEATCAIATAMRQLRQFVAQDCDAVVEIPKIVWTGMGSLYDRLIYICAALETTKIAAI
jgi:hypothetical protein